MVYFFNDKKYEDVTIHGFKCVLSSEYSESGPMFNIWNYPYIIEGFNILYANAVVDKKDKNMWEFTVEVKLNEFKNIGLGTFLMKKVSEWAYDNNVRYIYGFLSCFDKKKNWQASIPFYSGLPKKDNKIKNCYFVATKEQVIDNPKQFKLNRSQLETMYSGFVSIEIG